MAVPFSFCFMDGLESSTGLVKYRPLRSSAMTINPTNDNSMVDSGNHSGFAGVQAMISEHATPAAVARANACPSPCMSPRPTGLRLEPQLGIISWLVSYLD